MNPVLRFSAVASCVAILSAGAASAQNLEIRRVDLTGALTAAPARAATFGGSIPPEIVEAIRRAPITRTIIPIQGEEKFGEQIIKADEIVFSEGARMTLTNLSAPWIVVAARRFKFNDPERWTLIQRDYGVRTAAPGAAGGAGAQGQAGAGETNRTGNPGYPGGPGGPGTTGGSRGLPDVYLIVGDFVDPAGSLPPGLINLALLFPGVEGGEGGDGGRGGNGGRGAPGKEGATSAFDCKDGAGPGGRGGDAGAGGRGGDGGDGGRGANLTYLSTATGIEVLSYARVNNTGGRGGAPGTGGIPGTPGGGGPGAGRNGWCGPSGPGASGGYPSPVNLGNGSMGTDGAKGSVLAVAVPTVETFFKAP